MAKKLNIPTPSPAEFNLAAFGPNGAGANGIGNAVRILPGPLPAAADIGIGKLLQEAPAPVQNATNLLLHPSPQQIINDYLRLVPQSAINTMPEFDGNTLDGSPIYANLEVAAVSWTDMSTGNKKSFDAMSFNTVLMSVQQNKNIVETQIQGSDSGAILEYSGLNNYSITIHIIVTGSNGIYPQSDIDNIAKMLTCPTELKISSWYLNTFDIYSIVIRSYDIQQERGGISQQAITIQAQSTNSVSLIIQ